LITVACDTNVLAYAEGVNGAAKKSIALELFEKLSPASTLIPVQALGELFNVLVKKSRWSRGAAQRAVLAWGDTFPVIDTGSSVVLGALDLTQHHQLSIWDSVILSAAADARCRLLLSEDFQEGFTWSGVTVTNPFASTRHPLLDAILHA
jgi:predicted nucleic acid-binding protein